MKRLLISHITDPDGIMPVILTDLVFDDYDYKLLEAKDVDEYMKESMQNDTFSQYDEIIITDLSFSVSVADMINNSPLKDKIHLFDHHEGALELNDYPFAKVISEQNSKRESGTTIYYNYLLTNYDNHVIRKECVKDMVELVRVGDTWDTSSPLFLESRKLGALLANYGILKFISKYTSFLRESDTFYFDETEKTILEIDERRKDEYIENLKDKVIIRDVQGYKVGFVFAEQYRSEVGNTLANYYKNEVDLVAAINLNRSLSFRSLDDKADVNAFASLFNGKGHIHAAGAPIPLGFNEHLIDYLIDMIRK